MPIITLTTDLGYRDPYLAIVKAKLLAADSPPQVVDLSCELRDNHISDAAFIVRNAIPHFPAGTIHLVAVKFISGRGQPSQTGHIDNSRFLVTRHAGQFVLSPDNGLFTLLDPAFSSEVYQLYYEGEEKRHFFLKDVFVPAALHISAGGNVADIASPVTDYYRAFQFESYLQGNVLRGKGIYVDDFGNIITNITRAQFEAHRAGRNFTITLPGTTLNTVHRTYEEVRYGEPLVIFNSFGYLEVAANGRSAFKMLCPRDIGTSFDFTLLVEFHD
jgi:S-adenosyl-L-methionine hydrolase (adenosine-forming)